MGSSPFLPLAFQYLKALFSYLKASRDTLYQSFLIYGLNIKLFVIQQAQQTTSGSLLITLLLNYQSSPILRIIKVFIIKEEHSLKPIITLFRREEQLATPSFLYLINALILRLLINFIVRKSAQLGALKISKARIRLIKPSLVSVPEVNTTKG